VSRCRRPRVRPENRLVGRNVSGRGQSKNARPWLIH
jgi:hypothetical protein